MCPEPTPAVRVSEVIDLGEAPGWKVLDPDGNVVDSGPIIQLEAVGNPDDEEQE